MRVCVAAGSRGIDRIDQVVGAVVGRLREAGATVFIVPAMGSHGGATAEGQLEVLAGYGITPESMGCEIRSSMETIELGEVEPGVPVFVDRNAFEDADLIVPVNRVKPHTGFSGPVESGLMKMLAIGLGKQKGADTFHRRGYDAFAAHPGGRAAHDRSGAHRVRGRAGRERARPALPRRGGPGGADRGPRGGAARGARAAWPACRSRTSTS